MIVYSTKQYLPTRSNFITLDFKNFGYLYVTAPVYEAGVRLSYSKIFSDKTILETMIRPKDKEYRESIGKLFDILPFPLKPLSYMLYLTTEEYYDLEDQIGVLSVILQYSQPYYWFDTPRMCRSEFNFGKSIRREYQLSWKEFFEYSIEYDKIINPDKAEKMHPIYVMNVSPYQDLPQATTFIQPSSNSAFNYDTTKPEAVLNQNGSVDLNINFDEIEVSQNESFEEKKEEVSDNYSVEEIGLSLEALKLFEDDEEE